MPHLRESEFHLGIPDMTTRLSPDDYVLLAELAGGTRTISNANPRDGAERLVAADYATSRSLNMSTVEYEITARGKLALMLKQFGVQSTRFSVEPHRLDVDGLWYLKIASDGNPTVLMSIGEATKLAIALRSISADDMANDLDSQILKARRYAGA